MITAPRFWSRAINVTEGPDTGLCETVPVQHNTGTCVCVLGQVVATPRLAVAPGWLPCGLEGSSVVPGSCSHSSSSSSFAGPQGVAYTGAQCSLPLCPSPRICLQHEPVHAAMLPALESGEQAVPVAKTSCLVSVGLHEWAPCTSSDSSSHPHPRCCWSRLNGCRPGSRPPAVYLPKNVSATGIQCGKCLTNRESWGEYFNFPDQSMACQSSGAQRLWRWE